jgi:hypothetical protein
LLSVDTRKTKKKNRNEFENQIIFTGGGDNVVVLDDDDDDAV